MKTEAKIDKKFDTVELQHKIRTKLSKKISKMSTEDEMELFKSAGERAKKRRAKR
jgi:hypothetical protein